MHTGQAGDTDSSSSLPVYTAGSTCPASPTRQKLRGQSHGHEHLSVAQTPGLMVTCTGLERACRALVRGQMARLLRTQGGDVGEVADEHVQVGVRLLAGQDAHQPPRLQGAAGDVAMDIHGPPDLQVALACDVGASWTGSQRLLPAASGSARACRGCSRHGRKDPHVQVRWLRVPGKCVGDVRQGP